jgi:hypothetical protein
VLLEEFEESQLPALLEEAEDQLWENFERALPSDIARRSRRATEGKFRERIRGTSRRCTGIDRQLMVQPDTLHHRRDKNLKPAAHANSAMRLKDSRLRHDAAVDVDVGCEILQAQPLKPFRSKEGL